MGTSRHTADHGDRGICYNIRMLRSHWGRARSAHRMPPYPQPGPLTRHQGPAVTPSLEALSLQLEILGPGVRGKGDDADPTGALWVPTPVALA